MIERSLILAERVARNAIPELAGRPLYLVEPRKGSTVTSEMIDHCMGIFYRGLDRILQPQLEAENRWQGPGIAIVVNASGYYSTALHNDDAHRAIIGTTLHELSHWLDRPEMTEAEPEERDRDTTFAAACESLAAPEAQPSRYLQAFLKHGASFIRLCCHLWYRTTHGGGCILRPFHLTFGNDYAGLSKLHSPEQYIAALHPELEACRELPLREVAAIKPPSEITALWKEDFERMFLSTTAVALLGENNARPREKSRNGTQSVAAVRQRRLSRFLRVS